MPFIGRSGGDSPRPIRQTRICFRSHGNNTISYRNHFLSNQLPALHSICFRSSWCCRGRLMRMTNDFCMTFPDYYTHIFRRGPTYDVFSSPRATLPSKSSAIRVRTGGLISDLCHRREGLPLFCRGWLLSASPLKEWRWVYTHMKIVFPQCAYLSYGRREKRKNQRTSNIPTTITGIHVCARRFSGTPMCGTELGKLQARPPEAPRSLARSIIACLARSLDDPSPGYSRRVFV